MYRFSGPEYEHIELSEDALNRRMAALAALKCDGAARLRLPERERRRLNRRLCLASRLARSEAGASTLRRLSDSGALLMTRAQVLCEARGRRLPAQGGVPCVLRMAEALCQGGEAVLSRERVLHAARAFESKREWTLSELWAIPQALALAMLRALEALLEEELVCARQRAAAERYVRSAARGKPFAPACDQPPGLREAWAAAGLQKAALMGQGRALCRAAFYEHALKAASDLGAIRVRVRLEEALRRQNLAPEEAVAAAHAAQARRAVRFENLTAGLRLLDDWDWQADFEALSAVERALREDAAGIYPRMDDASRQAVRRQAEVIARTLKVTEAAVARQAAALSLEEAESPRAGVCRYLMTDGGRRALAARLGAKRTRLRRVVPDPGGKGLVAVLTGTSALALWGLVAWTGRPGFVPILIPLAWRLANAVVERGFSWLFPPATFLRLEMSRVPDGHRTLVTVPVLLSGAARVEAACDQLEALGALETDRNLGFLLLGDFADADEACVSGDDAVVEAARRRIEAMNRAAGRAKYFYLHRPRTLLAADGRWMGRDRKRGALMDLNRLLLGEDGAEAAFAAEGAACPKLRGRYAHVITLDADTRVLPGTFRALIGALAHPLNRRFAVLQPRMELHPSACVNAFVRLFAGAGGVDVYPVALSSLWQDVTGTGIYAGKGIYDVAAFQHALDGALPEGRILSHDLVEGALAGAGFVGDIALYDGAPTTLSGWLNRQHRWIRGDWQLLPLILRRRLSGGRTLRLADRARMLGNLLRSLEAPALMALLILAVGLGDENALLAGLALAALNPVMNLFGSDELKWRRAAVELALLPASAWNALDAVARTLWRLSVSGRRLLDWVTAADGEGTGGRHVPGVAAALLLLPGLLTPQRAAALSLGTLFAVGASWAGDMAGTPLEERPGPDHDQRLLLTALARDTWRFFERYVPLGGAALPPDNVQLDPAPGVARRTSPTNIGLYLVGALAACRLGFTSPEALRARLWAAMDAMAAMEKWRGHLFNWVDLDGLAPLSPRYVSAVDSGNLAAALLLCAGAEEVREDASLASALEGLARGMDFAALYDARRRLFFIGWDADAGRMSDAHYDLLASEARTLSYVAMMLGQVDASHWRRLGRPCAATRGGGVLLSWSGTLFEYLMPEIFLPAPKQTLLGGTVRGALRAQARFALRRNRPWGVSESGFYAFDERMNYQYRAFGLRALALSDRVCPYVVAPYATALAAPLDPGAASENLNALVALGAAGACGMYEALDYLRPDPSGAPAVVKSHMAHHQGMALCALCNALTDGSLSRDFMNRPEARALSLLLEEKPFARPRVRPSRTVCHWERPRPAMDDPGRRALSASRLVETQLLRGGDAWALVTDDGAVHCGAGNVEITRFHGDLLNRTDAARLWIEDLDTGEVAALGGADCETWYAPGVVTVAGGLSRIKIEQKLCLSPGDGTLVRALRLEALGGAPVRCAVTEVMPLMLSPAADARAHAVYQQLFVVSRRLSRDALLFHRRSRYPGEATPRWIHMVRARGAIEAESDYEALIGRGKDRPAPVLSGKVGAVLNPVGALSARLTLEPGRPERAHFASRLLKTGERAAEWLERCREEGFAERALRLASARARAALDYLDLDAAQHALLNRLAACLVDGRLAAEAKAAAGALEGTGNTGAYRREALWALGLSGDRPILLLRAAFAGEEEVRAAVRAHAWYRAMGFETDLVMVDDAPAGYDRPVRALLDHLVDASHLRTLRGAPGGVWLIDGGALPEEGRAALWRAASVILDAGEDFGTQLRRWLLPLDVPGRQSAPVMDIGPSTLKPHERASDNGLGGYLPDGGYEMDLYPGRGTPRPWCDLLANDGFGFLLSERGGGFFWAGSSREGRLTAYGNDGLNEGFGLMLTLTRRATGQTLRLLPGDRPQRPFRVRFSPWEISYAFEGRDLAGAVRFCLDGERSEARIRVELENRGLKGGEYVLTACVNWLMGAQSDDAARLRCRVQDGALLAEGACPGAAYLAARHPRAEGGAERGAFLGRGTMMAPEGASLPGSDGGWTLRVPVRLERRERIQVPLALGWAADAQAALARSRAFRREDGDPFQRAEARWKALSGALQIDTPDPALNRLVNVWLPHQVLASRVLGRTGLYQPGGAYGFRDQLQDMLAVLPYDPARVRRHLLRCAARQFEAGDVLHWWHEPYRGVRTRVTDDRLFLPWVAAAYVKATGDRSVLEERVAYLEDVPLPPDRDDLYRDFRPGPCAGTLHEHCLRAFGASAATGAHGLALMGGGDWNDGMNRLGAAGRGESVWLTMFIAACADAYAEVCPEADAGKLRRLADDMRRAVERAGWDGAWYLRAYMDDGTPLGGRGCDACRIDAIAQAWAVLSGLDEARCAMALDSAWAALVDEEAGVARLLTPGFDDGDPDPGYLRGYPRGVRENGAQYTHGACWLLLALIRRGDAERAHRLTRLLIPERHADTPEGVERYRVEPYVMAADICADPAPHGRGGWTWYTGSAAWMLVDALALLGYERRGDSARLNALLGDWPRAGVTLRFGGSRYRLVCERETGAITLDGRAWPEAFIPLVDDGAEHVAFFPPRDAKA